MSQSSENGRSRSSSSSGRRRRSPDRPSSERHLSGNFNVDIDSSSSDTPWPSEQSSSNPQHSTLDVVRMTPMDIANNSHNTTNFSSNDLTLSRRRRRHIPSVVGRKEDSSSLPEGLNQLSFANSRGEGHKKGPNKQHYYGYDQDGVSVAQETVTTAASTLDGTLASSVYSSGTRNTDTRLVDTTSPLIRLIPSHVDSVPQSFRTEEMEDDDILPPSLGSHRNSPPSIYVATPRSTVTATVQPIYATERLLQGAEGGGYNSRFRAEDTDDGSMPLGAMASRAPQPYPSVDRPQGPGSTYYSPFRVAETAQAYTTSTSNPASLTPGRETAYSPEVLSFGQFSADAIQTLIPDCQIVLLEAASLPTLVDVYRMVESPEQLLTPERIEQIQLVTVQIYKYQVRELLEASRHSTQQESTLLPYLCTTTQWSTEWAFIHPNDTQMVKIALPRLLLMRTDVSCIQDIVELLCNTGKYPSADMWKSGILLIVQHMCQIQGLPIPLVECK